MKETMQARWEAAEVRAPGVTHAIPVVVARAIPYSPEANRLQNLNIYLPANDETRAMIGRPAVSLPAAGSGAGPRFHVHVHGGAWRDPVLDASSIEPAVAHIFSSPDATPITAIASLNYTLTQFPTHPAAPYDAIADKHSDPAREAVHPRHVHDVYDGLALLRSYGLRDGSYILTAHSCGACIALQAVLEEPAFYGLTDVAEPPTPAAVVSINGLYDLPGLVLSLGAKHEASGHDYRMMLTNVFGSDDRVWASHSPARLNPSRIAARLKQGKVPPLVLIEQSPDDQLVPVSQLLRLEENLRSVEGMQVAVGCRTVGRHATPWQQGGAIRDSIQDTLRLLAM